MASTHEVTNQAPPLVGYDVFAADAALAEAVRRHAGADARPSCGRAGPRWPAAPRRRSGAGWPTSTRRCCAPTTATATASTRSSSTPPGTGCMSDGGRRTGCTARPGPTPGRRPRRARAAGFCVWSQVEAGHGCPISMTYAVGARRCGTDPAWPPTLGAAADLAALRAGPAPTGDKRGLLAGMGMTEKQGGSDVRANTTARGAGRRRQLSAHRAQVVLLGADVATCSWCSRRRRGGLTCFLRAAGAAGRHAQRVRDPAAEGQARQPVQRLGRGGVRRHRRLAGRRARAAACRTIIEMVGDDPARLRARHRRR